MIMGILKAKDETGKWVDVPASGPQGPRGPTGPTGPQGMVGPTAPGMEVRIGSRRLGSGKPLLAGHRNLDLWYDSDELWAGEIAAPEGAAAGEVLVKASDSGNEVVWAGPHLPVAGGTITGDLTITGNLDAGVLVEPTVNGDVHFNNSISAESVEDRTAYPWEYWSPYTADGFTFDTYSTVARNRYQVIVNLRVRQTGGAYGENYWRKVSHPSQPLPAGWRPNVTLFDLRVSVTNAGDVGPLFKTKIDPDGHYHVWMLASSGIWNEWHQITINYSYPRYGG